MNLSRRQRRVLKVIVSVLAIGAAGANWIAYAHARAMTRFVKGGERTRPPEALNRWEKIGVLFTGVQVPRPQCERTPASVGMPFESVRFPGARGTQLEAWLIDPPGSTGLVLLFHGYAGAKDSMLEVAAAFQNMGLGTLLVDFHGSGGSTGSETSIGYFEGDDVAAAMAFAEKRAPGRPTVLYGCSMGAAAVLCAVDRHRLKPAALILDCPFDSLLRTVRHRFELMHVPSTPLAHLLVFWGGVQQGFNGFRHNPVRYAHSVECPVLLASGAKDSRADPADTQRIFDALRGPKTLKVFQDAGHGTGHGAQPDEWSNLVRGVLTSAQIVTR